MEDGSSVGKLGVSSTGFKEVNSADQCLMVHAFSWRLRQQPVLPVMSTEQASDPFLPVPSTCLGH